jgi:hypothetical protein
MLAHSIFEAADCPAAEQVLLTIGRAGVLSSRAIDTEDLAALFHLLGPPSERKRSGLKRATDIVLVEDGRADLMAAHGRAVRAGSVPQKPVDVQALPPPLTVVFVTPLPASSRSPAPTARQEHNATAQAMLLGDHGSRR